MIITSAVNVHITTVSINGSSNATSPSDAAYFVFTAEWAIDAEPTPASFENAAQANQAAIVLKDLLGMESTFSGAIIGLLLAVIVGIIIIGGIKRIASVTEKIVPFMALLYIIACIYILAVNFSFLDDAFALIFQEAFNPTAVSYTHLTLPTTPYV